MLTIPNLPFYWRFEKQLSKHDLIPEKLDFNFDVDGSLGLLIENKSSDLLNILDQVYLANANIGYMIDGHNLANNYGLDYISFLRRVTDGFVKKNIIDIGAGGCLLLELMRNEGANVLGVDPSPVAQKAATSKNIPLINDFFRPGLLPDNQADLITQMDVFEHVYDPLSLLGAQADALVDGGVICINVPNCEYSIEIGDISMAIHQHVNMFTRYSLCKLVEQSGLYVRNLEVSGYGSALYCAASKRKKDSKFRSDDFKYQNDWLNSFSKLAKERIANFEYFYNKNINTNLGVFIFQRALPYFAASGIAIDQFRFFDNNALWHNKMLDGLPRHVENSDDFVRNSPNATLIMSNTFGRELKNQLLNSGASGTIYLQSDIFHG